MTDEITKAYRELRALIDNGTLRMGKTVWTNDEPDVDRWQPIETAPKDGTVILVVWLGRVEMALWHEEYHKWQEYPDGDFADVDDELSHWMPLPEPPK